MVDSVKNRDHYTYQCQVCGFENVKKRIPHSGVPVTKLGDYGSNATPTPQAYTETNAMMSSRTISFAAVSGSTPAKISDSRNQFGETHFKGGMPINITTESGVNDGNYTIAAMGVLIGDLSLSSTDSLTTETAAAAGLVTIYRRSYRPNVTTGCPLCGSLNSKN
uniref:Uncharacterized protein n=1 Tax=viral metagenome TaxID=1070528 RepID=A0A6H1ZKP4_9ZZZZ